MKGFVQFIGVTVGVILTALGLDMFLVPNKIAAGGVSGLATILYYLFHMPVGLVMLLLNIPLFIMGFYRLGLGFVIRSLYGTVALSVAVDILAPVLPVPTGNLLLASLYGGILSGLGLGLVFRYKGTTGGTELLAAIIRTYTSMSTGQLLFLVDAAVVIAAGIVFNSAELALYALISIFVTAWLIDLVLEGFSYDRAFIIISEHSDKIAGVILKNLDRGVTALQGRGLYTGAQRDVLLSVVSRSEVSRLKEIVYEVDHRAFIIMTEVNEVLGEGFKEIHTEKRNSRKLGKKSWRGK
ncbi:YitT family protein [Desulfolucanica intricata]|uniref:YitT family protein n=1 Tax=Desulfolucanica intricata TaxID=1285191 RepID=UPI00082EAFB6|nr:YitT family protein [Desulfolucanica intricata]